MMKLFTIYLVLLFVNIKIDNVDANQMKYISNTKYLNEISISEHRIQGKYQIIKFLIKSLVEVDQIQ